MKTSTTKIKNAVKAPLQTLLEKKRELETGFSGKLDTLLREDNAAAEDLAPVFHDQFVALRLNQIDTSQLKLVNEALERIQQGVYGICSECAEPISPRRLQAIPWAVRCVPCEEAFVAAAESEESGTELAA